MFSESRNPKTLREVLTQYCTPTEDLLRDFERACTLIPLERGKAIVEQGKVCDVIVINRVGLFRVCRMEKDVEDTILFGTSGDVFTSMHSYYAGEPSIFSLVAVEDSEAWVITYGMFRNLQSRYPELVKWMSELMVEQMFGFEKRYLFFSNRSAEERFLNFLRIQNKVLRRASVKYISGIVPLKYIAQYLKITQSTLSRLRKKFVSME